MFGAVHFPVLYDVWFVFYFHHFTELPVFNANSVDPEQTPHSVASDQGLSCFQCPFYGTLGINGLTAFLTGDYS